MKSTFRIVLFAAAMYTFSALGWSQSTPTPDQAPVTASAQTQKSRHHKDKKAGPGKEMGKGGEDVGKGVGKGTGDLAKGTAGAAGSLAHGNVGGAGESLGKGAGGLGKNVAVGTGKGIGKIGKGLGGEFKKLGGKKHKGKN